MIDRVVVYLSNQAEESMEGMEDRERVISAVVRLVIKEEERR